MKYIPEIITALERVGSRYLRVPTIHKPEGIIRERIFCYELYHQIRLVLSPQESIVIHGEIDKAGYPEFNRQNPDFVFHKPGSNEFNSVVCEVKGDLRVAGVKKDLTTLSYLLQTGLYENGVLIVYGFTTQYFASLRRQLVLTSLTADIATKILLITLPTSGKCEEPINLHQLFWGS